LQTRDLRAFIGFRAAERPNKRMQLAGGSGLRNVS